MTTTTLLYTIEDEVMDTLTHYYSDNTYEMTNILGELISKGKNRSIDFDHDSPNQIIDHE